MASLHGTASSLLYDVLRMARPAQPEYCEWGASWWLRSRSKGRDLRALAAIVSEDCPNLPDGEGLPPSLLADLMALIRCDVISFEGFDSQREKTRFLQSIPDPDRDWLEEMDPVHWQHYWDCQPVSYPDRTADLRNVVKIADFYTTRQWHSTGMYSDRFRAVGFELEHNLMLTLPAAPGPARRSPARACGT